MLVTRVTTANLDKVQQRIKERGEAGMQLAAAALNDGIAYAKKQGGEDILAQVNFPEHYLDLPDRFQISQKAIAANPVASLSARHRATSLGTFLVGRDKNSVSVKVKRQGAAKRFKGAYVAGLKRGQRFTGNRGVALRIKHGDTLRGRDLNTARLPVLREDKWGTVYLLYGPSVNQVASDVFPALQPKISRFIVERYLQLEKARFGGRL